MAYYDFKKDIEVATSTEKEVAHLLEKVYGAQIMSFEDTNRYDFLALIKGKPYRFEVKEDFICETTGNVGVEFSCRGKDSGIRTTQADYYIYKLHTKDGIRFTIHQTSVLKEKIQNDEYFRIVDGGDKGSRSLNYLFKYDIFVRGGKLIPLSSDSKVNP